MTLLVRFFRGLWYIHHPSAIHPDPRSNRRAAGCPTQCIHTTRKKLYVVYCRSSRVSHWTNAPIKRFLFTAIYVRMNHRQHYDDYILFLDPASFTISEYTKEFSNGPSLRWLSPRLKWGLFREHGLSFERPRQNEIASTETTDMGTKGPHEKRLTPFSV